MDRRTFNKLAGLGAIQAVSGPAFQAAQPPSSAIDANSDPGLHETAHIPARAVEWPSRTYRRLLVDTHVPDWDDRLLASFDPIDYVSTIAGAGFQTLMQYANRLVGMVADHAKLGAPVKDGDWNQYLIVARGPVILHILNGQLMAVLIDDDPASSNNISGLFGLQVEGVPCKVSFRNLWLKKIA